jgi:DNA gyrase subunit B/topoisomerase-4 subunit B
MSENGYDQDSIEILESRDAVRERPGMYVGGEGKKGLHHILWEIVDNSVDEAMNDYAEEIEVILHEDEETVTVKDDGRGIPVEDHEDAGQSTLIVILTVLHAGGKFDENESYKASGGLHGVGAAVTNFLSEKMIARVRRDEKVHQVKFERGKPVSDVGVVDEYSKYSKSESSGTEIVFRPDDEIFDSTEFDEAVIKETLETKTYINPGLVVKFVDQKNEEEYKFKHEKGIDEYLHRMVEKDSVSPVQDELIHLEGQEGDITFTISFTWTDHTDEEYASFVNAIPTTGGTHQKGFQKGVSAALKTFIDQAGIGPKRLDIKARDTREGLYAVINLFAEGDVQFRGQTKEEFNNPEVKGQIKSFIKNELGQYFLNNSETAEKIGKRVVKAAKARKKSRSETKTNLKKKSKRRADLPSKLADCTSNDPNGNELFLVEGASAGGNAKQARNRKKQAILPLRGKVLNAEGRSTSRILKNNELSNIVKSLGTGIGEKFDISHLRYEKIILLMDADSDGHHITTLLLTFFFRHLRELIENGHVYIAQPPLYQIKHGTDRYWALDDQEKDEILDDLDKRKKLTVSRFKGLGEMMKGALKETTLNPNKRRLIQVNIPDGEEDDADQVIKNLMGSKSEKRYEMITENLDLIDDLDV